MLSAERECRDGCDKNEWWFSWWPTRSQSSSASERVVGEEEVDGLDGTDMVLRRLSRPRVGWKGGGLANDREAGREPWEDGMETALRASMYMDVNALLASAGSCSKLAHP